MQRQDWSVAPVESNAPVNRLGAEDHQLLPLGVGVDGWQHGWVGVPVPLVVLLGQPDVAFDPMQILKGEETGLMD